ncbi:hypothetical protein HK102_002355, partial [Quaeritorhiza haematococci]
MDNLWYGIDRATDEQVVLKLQSRNDDVRDVDRDNDWFRAEANTLKELSRACPDRIIQYKAFVADDDEYILVMERAEATVLDVLIENDHLTEAQAQIVVRGVLEAIACTHEHGKVHRDLKPGNLFLLSKHDLDSVKLGDFGVAADEVGYFALNTRAGTLYYMAPEVLARKFYGRPCDMWSLGVVTWQLLFGEVPYIPRSRNERGMLAKIKKTTLQLPMPAPGKPKIHISPVAQNFLFSLLKLDPTNRPTAEEALQHPWITSAPPPTFYVARRLEQQAQEEAAAAAAEEECLPAYTKEPTTKPDEKPPLPRDERVIQGKGFVDEPVLGEGIPPGWRMVTKESGTVYFYHETTGVTSYEPPLPSAHPDGADPDNADDDDADAELDANINEAPIVSSSQISENEEGLPSIPTILFKAPTIDNRPINDPTHQEDGDGDGDGGDGTTATAAMGEQTTKKSDATGEVNAGDGDGWCSHGPVNAVNGDGGTSRDGVSEEYGPGLAVGAAEPFVGAIVGPYDPRLPTSVSAVNWFYVSTYTHEFGHPKQLMFDLVGHEDMARDGLDEEDFKRMMHLIKTCSTHPDRTNFSDYWRPDIVETRLEKLVRSLRYRLLNEGN